MSVLEKSLYRIFRVCCLLFSYQCSFFIVAVSCNSFCIISKHFMFVNNFFNLFFVLHLKHLFLVHQLIYNNIPFSGCQALFSTFFTFSWSAFYIQAHVYCRSMLLSFEQNGERGIRTLAPLLTTYSLSRGAPSASLGISPKRPVSNIHDSFLFVQYFFLIFHDISKWASGSGIQQLLL